MIIKEDLLEYLRWSNSWEIDEVNSWKYSGTLKQKDMDKIPLRAYVSWLNQYQRCYNKKHHAYKWYGAKGIEREWGSAEFVGWYVDQLLSRDSWSSPVVSRFGDKGNYRKGNCSVRERSENASLHISDNHKKIISKIGKDNGQIVYLVGEKDILGPYPSKVEAGRQLNKYDGFINSCIQRRNSFARIGKTEYKIISKTEFDNLQSET